MSEVLLFSHSCTTVHYAKQNSLLTIKSSYDSYVMHLKRSCPKTLFGYCKLTENNCGLNSTWFVPPSKEKPRGNLRPKYCCCFFLHVINTLPHHWQCTFIEFDLTHWAYFHKLKYDLWSFSQPSTAKLHPVSLAALAMFK